MAQIHLGDGKWVVSNCADMPSEKNCKLVIAAPESQREDLIEAGVAHMIKSHGHQDSPQLREEAGKMLTVLE